MSGRSGSTRALAQSSAQCGGFTRNRRVGTAGGTDDPVRTDLIQTPPITAGCVSRALSYAIDPIRSLRQRITGIGLAGFCAVAACAVWALRTPAVSTLWDERLNLELAPPQSLPPTEVSEQRQAFDPNLFAVKLWNPPPPP